MINYYGIVLRPIKVFFISVQSEPGDMRMIDMRINNTTYNYRDSKFP